jgi:flagellar M-ring protein FliF
MKATNVAVIDSRGTVLSAVGVGPSGGTDKKAGDYEERVRTAVQTMLDQVVGPGNATVVVAADINYESAERLEETFTTPEDAPTLSESIDTETFQGSGDRAAAGVLGPDNIGTPATSQNGEYVSESAVRNNAINKVTEQRIIPAGAIKRQSVSVAINASAADGIDVKNIAALVTSAAGISEDRGDEVTVEVVKFNQVGSQEATEALAAAEQAATADRFAEIVRTAIITLGVAIPLAILLVIFGRRSRRQSRQELELSELEQQRAIMNAETVPVSLVGAPKPIGSTHMLDEPIDTAQRRADIDALAEKDPGRTAEFLRSLMDEKQPV